MKKGFRFKRAAGLLLAALLLLTALPALADAFEHTYTGGGQYGEVVGVFQTMLFELKGPDGAVDLAYCVDNQNYIVTNGKYERTNLEDADYFTGEQAARLRAVVRASYPAITIEALRTASGIADLTTKQAITGTQLAIWSISNSDDGATSPDAKIMALKAYLLALPPVGAASAKIGKIVLTSDATYDGNRCSVLYRYTTDAVNADGSPVTLSYGFLQDLAALGARVESETAIENGMEVLVKDVPTDADLDFFVQGEQDVVWDAYFYSPEGGRNASQSLIGTYSGKTKLYAVEQFCVEVPGEYQLKIHKYDSKTSAGIQGAVFQLANNADFTSPVVYEQTTNAEGFAVFSGLTAGMWYLREKTAPTGYVPDVNVYDVEIDEEPQGVIEFKNAHYGQIKILKVDETGAPLAGAKFDIYRGTEKIAENLIASGLVTNDEGVIVEGELVPGKYLVVETEAPYGYHLCSEPEAIVEVVSHETASVAMENPAIKRGRIGVAKEDRSSGERLPGAVIGVYSDEACTVELAKFTTTTEPQYTELLMPGTYYVKELEAPEGYILNPESAVQTVELAEGGEELVVFRNRKRIDTAGNYGLLLLIGVIALGVTGVTAVLLRKKLVKER